MKKQLFFTAFSLVATAVFGQKPGGVDQSQEIIRNFDARLIDAEKQKTAPLLPAVDTSTRVQNYNIQPRTVNVDYLAPKLRPIPIKPEAVPPVYRGYIKAGYGLPNSPYAEAAYNIAQAKSYNVNVNVKHHSANYTKLANQRFSRTGGEVAGSFFAKAGVGVDAKVAFNQNAQYLYGYNHVTNPNISEAAAKQFFNYIDLGAKVYNSQKTVLDFNYSAGVNFNSTSDNYSASENNLEIPIEGTKWFAEKHPLTIKIKPTFTSLDTNGNVSQTLNNVYLQPSFTYHSDVFKLKIGANIVYANDEFKPMPDIEATINAFGNGLAIYGGWKGDFLKNSMRNLSQYNPYIMTVQANNGKGSLKIRNTEQTEYYVGIKGGIAVLDYLAQVGWQQNNNLALFLSDTTEQFKRFTTLYDTVNIFNIRGTVSLRPIKKLELTATASQNVYTPKNQARAWGLPSLDLNVGAKYTLAADKMFAKANLFVQNGVNYINSARQPDRLGSLYDLSLGLEYLATKNFGLFLDVNNILNNKRERWYNYPTYGLNILGGLTVRF